MAHVREEGHFRRELYNKVIIGPPSKMIILIMHKNIIVVKHRPTFSHQPTSEIKAIINLRPFQKRVLDIVGPLHLALGQIQFLIMATWYFFKWIEAESLARI